jgi:hypothetical protein
MSTKWGWAFVLLAACAGAADPAPPTEVDATPTIDVEACAPPPAGFVAWRSGDLVKVSKPLGDAFVGGATVRAEVRNISADSLPTVVDFGDHQIEVRQDLSLCLVDG